MELQNVGHFDRLNDLGFFGYAFRNTKKLVKCPALRFAPQQIAIDELLYVEQRYMEQHKNGSSLRNAEHTKTAHHPGIWNNTKQPMAPELLFSEVQFLDEALVPFAIVCF